MVHRNAFGNYEIFIIFSINFKISVCFEIYIAHQMMVKIFSLRSPHFSINSLMSNRNSVSAYYGICNRRQKMNLE